MSDSNNKQITIEDSANYNFGTIGNGFQFYASEISDNFSEDIHLVTNQPFIKKPKKTTFGLRTSFSKVTQKTNQFDIDQETKNQNQDLIQDKGYNDAKIKINSLDCQENDAIVANNFDQMEQPWGINQEQKQIALRTSFNQN